MRVKNLTKIYKTNAEHVLALDDMTLDFPKKGMVFIVGVSGSGKSTLMNILSGVDYPTDGEVFIGDKSLYGKVHDDMSGYRNSYVGFVFQDYNLIEDLNVYDNIKLPLEFLGIKDLSIIDDVMKKVDIEEIRNSKVSEISSGQMQRVAIARCLVKNSQVILADEPTGNLDSKNTTIVMDMLKEISKERLVIVITHDDESAHKYGDSIISLEDGKMIDYEDKRPNDVIEEDKENIQEKVTFKKPKITFFQQCKFTLGFIRNNLARSLAILIIMILMPIIGNIMSGYAFFDISESYTLYQEKYDSQYINLAKQSGELEFYYSEDDINEIYEKYPKANFIEKYSTYVNLNINEMEEDIFYKPVIRNILVSEQLGEYIGELPTVPRLEIMITDYLYESYKHYQNVTDYKNITISLDGVDCKVVGVLKTNYEKFKELGEMDQYQQMAFDENTEYYNAVVTYPKCYDEIFDKISEYHEKISYRRYTEGKGFETFFDEILISTDLTRTIDVPENKSIIPTENQALRVSNDYGTDEYFIGVSTGFLASFYNIDYEEVLNNYKAAKNKTQEINSKYTERIVITGYSKSKMKMAYYVGAIYESEEKEITFSWEHLFILCDELKQCRLMISVDDPSYQQIVANENVTNQSYNYAYSMMEKAESTKISMFQFLIALLVILIVFASIMNSMTIASEKKKIGIKYSFGINKGPIVVPYILELILYIIIGFSLSVVFVKGGVYQSFLKNYIYDTPEQLMEFSFYYINFDIMIYWDLIIYSIMIGSLVIMILRICRKSPIEIIKDL